ncbi:MAG: hypothetical protein HON90_13845, partial [Halobacteriovoraceae bacterium]|nr:hypothetical protein [Halobacteriovoraceae bacterium]
MSIKVNLVFFGFNGKSSLINELASFYQNSSKFDVEQINEATEVIQYLSTSMNGIFFFKINNKVDLQSAVSVLKALKKPIKKGLIKPACLIGIKNKKVENILAKYGCMNLLEPDSKPKTVSFKLDFWSRSIIDLIKKQELDEELKLKRHDNNKNVKTKSKEDFKFIKPLELQSDFWLVKHKNDCKKILRRWLLVILGPSPAVGNWVELEAQPGDKLPTWKYVVKDSEEKKYIADEGAWFFYGSKPEFDWKINRWNFSSDLPHLYFYTREGTVFSRFKYIEGQVEVCENSQFAQLREEIILASCDMKHNFDGDGPTDEDKSNLEGDSETESLKNLEGDSKHQEEDLAGSLSGEIKPSIEDIEGDGHKKKSGYEEEPLDGNMTGKSSTDELGGDPLSGKLKPGEEKNQAADKQSGFKEDAIDGNMSGKSSTDELGGDPLSGKLKPGEEKNQAADKKSGFKEDPLGGNMGGKSATDELGSDPLSGKLKPGETKKAADKKGGFKEDAIDGHMGGKSATDE